MEDIVFMKTKDDGLWENHPYLAFTILLIICVIIFFVLLISSVFVGKILGVIMIIAGICILVLDVIITLNSVAAYFYSKSTAFIKRNGKMYAVELLTNPSRGAIYAPSGTLTQTATLPHNYKVAQEVQSSYRIIKEKRSHKENFIKGLDDILNELTRIPDHSAIYKDLSGFYIIQTENDCYGYIDLNDPKIEKITKKYFYVSYLNFKNERTVVKFRKAYDNLIEEINKMN